MEHWSEILTSVMDPEIPVLSVIDLGVIRQVEQEGNHLTVSITPTYTGCPAMDVIEMNVKAALDSAGYITEIKRVIAPPWTTDWISEEGKQKLKAYGIAPPQTQARIDNYLFEKHVVPCPRCQSNATDCVSEFGSTACKAQYVCLSCKEPFDYFKCH